MQRCSSFGSVLIWLCCLVLLLIGVVIEGAFHKISRNALPESAKIGLMDFAKDVRIGCLSPYVGVPRPRLRLHFVPFGSGYGLRTLEVGSVLRSRSEYANALLFNHGARGEAVQHIYILGGMWGDDCRKTGWLKLFCESLSSVKPKDISISRFIRFDGIHVQGYRGDPRTLLQMGSGESRVKRRLALGVASLGVPLALLQRPANGLEILLIRGFKVRFDTLGSRYDFVGLPTTSDNFVGAYDGRESYHHRSDSDDSITAILIPKSIPPSSDYGRSWCFARLLGWSFRLVGLCCIFYGVVALHFCCISRAATLRDAAVGLICLVVGCIVWHTGTRLLSADTVPQKYHLTSSNYWGTVIAIRGADMANVLSTDKQVAVISALAEGSGIRQIERITGVHRDTIMRLGVRVGRGCANLLDAKMRDLSCNHLQFDEIWGFIGKKERHCTLEDSPEVGDVWTFCAIDEDTKTVPSFKVGKRDTATANAFVADVASRMRNRVQISADALRAYVDAVELAFGANVDFAQIVKSYVHDDPNNAERRYSAPEFVIEEKKRIAGMPDMSMASTSHIERLNGTTRLHMRRLTRLTYAFSKKRENFEAAVALHFAYYNFVKRHNTIRCTPAMAAGIERDFWTVKDLVGVAA